MPLIHSTLTIGQPLLKAFVGLSVPRQQALKAAGQPVPSIVSVTFLIDTGASGTCVDPNSVSTLGLVPTGAAQIQTPSTNGMPHSCNTYDISLIIPSPMGMPFLVNALPVVESVLKPQGIDGLMGRDVLSMCTLYYNGPEGSYTLAY